MKLPSLPIGPVIPTPNLISDAEKIINENKVKEQRIHDYKVAFIGALGGALFGFVSSFIIWLITK